MSILKVEQVSLVVLLWGRLTIARQDSRVIPASTEQISNKMHFSRMLHLPQPHGFAGLGSERRLNSEERPSACTPYLILLNIMATLTLRDQFFEARLNSEMLTSPVGRNS